MKTMQVTVKTLFTRYAYPATLLAAAAAEAFTILARAREPLPLIVGAGVIAACLAAIKYPRTGLLIICALKILGDIYPSLNALGTTVYFSVLAVGFLWAYRPLWVAAGATVACIAGSAVDVLRNGTGAEEIPFIVAAYAVPSLLGLLVLTLRDRIAAERVAGEKRLLEYQQSLAAEMHDSVTHLLVQIKLLAETEQLTDAARPQFQAVSRLAGQALSELRDLTNRVRSGAAPAASASLAATLSELGASSAEVGLILKTELLGDPAKIPAEVQSQLRIICTELTTNMLKHADRSAPASLVIKVGERQVRIFSANTVPPAAAPDATYPSSHQGVGNLRARVEKMGGTFTASVNDGTWTATATIPLSC